jgi:hypothetical protein
MDLLSHPDAHRLVEMQHSLSDLYMSTSPCPFFLFALRQGNSDPANLVILQFNKKGLSGTQRLT